MVTSAGIEVVTMTWDSTGGANDSRLLLQTTNSGSAINDGLDVKIDTSGNALVWNYENALLGFGTNNTQRMTIDSSGNVGIGITNTLFSSTRLDVKGSDSSAGIARIRNSSTGSNADVLYLSIDYSSNPTSNNIFTSFRYGGGDASVGSVAGSISGNGSGGISFNTTSDERLKENIVSTKFGLDDIRSLQVRDYNYIGSRKLSTGFIAQELYDVFPNAVNVGGENKFEDPWTVDYSKITPLIVASIQELSDNFDVLNIADPHSPLSKSAINIGEKGNVGIGTNNPTHKLEVAGNIFVTAGGKFRSNMPGSAGATATVCYNGSGYFDSCVSLRKFKTEIVPLEYGLDLIKKMEPVTYRLKGSEEREMGFIAEDLSALDPRFAQKGTNGKLTGVKYDKITSLLTKGVQQLAQKAEEQQRDIDKLFDVFEHIGLTDLSQQIKENREKMNIMAGRWQQQEKRDREQERKIASLEIENSKLENRVEKLEQENRLLKDEIEKIKRALNIK